MARLHVALVVASLAAVCAAVFREDVSTEQVRTKEVKLRTDSDILERPTESYDNREHHRRHFRHHGDGDATEDYPHHHHHHHRHHHHHHHHGRHHRGPHSFEGIVTHFVRTEGEKSGLNTTDVTKLVEIVRAQLLANREDLRQDRSNWTEPQFRAQHQRVHARLHEDFKALATRAVSDQEHLAVFFRNSEAKSKEFKLKMLEIQKARLQRFAHQANVSSANFERFMSVVAANPLEVMPRRNMSITERTSLLRATNVEWMKIKELTTRDMSQEDKEKMESFFDLVQEDYIRNLQRHRHPHHRHHHRHHQFRPYEQHHGYNRRHHHDSEENDDEPEFHHHHRHRHHHHRHHHDESEMEDDRSEEAPRRHEHHHRRHHHHHRHHDDDTDEDTPRPRHAKHHEERDEEVNRRPRHHHRDHAQKQIDEKIDNSNDQDNEIVPTRRPVYERVRGLARRAGHHRTPYDDE